METAPLSPNLRPKKRIAVLGSGAFGTAMANLWRLHDHDVILWGRDADTILEIQTRKTNTKYLAAQKLEDFAATTDLRQALQDPDYVVLAVPCQQLRGVLTSVRGQIRSEAVFVNLAKGLEIDTCQWPHQIFADVLGQNVLRRLFAIAGPTFSHELLQRVPTAATLAGQNETLLTTCQQDLSLDWFRLYTSTDLLGVEVAAATKNIFAIAVGVLEGLGFGQNSRASFITRTLFEMTQFGVALGAKPQTFAGLSGVGDLILTCTGGLSRNRQVGVRLGQGETLHDILKSMTSVAEGVPTTKSIHQLITSQKTLQNLDLPNLEAMYRVLFEDHPPKQAVQELLSRRYLRLHLIFFQS